MARTRVLISIIVAGICGLTLAATPASAKHGHTDPAKHLDKLTKKLKLTDEQRGQVDGILKEYQQRMQALHEQFEALHKEKHDKIKTVLTPEQQEKFDAMHEMRKMKDDDDDDKDDDKAEGEEHHKHHWFKRHKDHDKDESQT